MSKKRTTKRTQGKSADASLEELVEALAPALGDEVAKALKAGKDDEGEGGDLADLADVVQDIIAIADEKRKSRKESDGDDADLTEADVAEIAEEVASLLDEAKSDDEDDEAKEEDDEKDDDEKDEEDEKRKGARRSSSQSIKRRGATRRPPTPAQRKYANNFMVPGSSAGGGSMATLTKSQEIVNLARAAKCSGVFGSGRNDPEQAAYYARKNYSDATMAREFKALTATSPTSGGFLIPQVYMDEIIELLYAETVVRELGARPVSMENGNLIMPKVRSGSRARWTGEARPKGATNSSGSWTKTETTRTMTSS